VVQSDADDSHASELVTVDAGGEAIKHFQPDGEANSG